MRRKLLVSGAAGFVAGSVIVHALHEWQVYAVDKMPGPASGDNLTSLTLDLGDAGQLSENFRKIDPHAVIHTAALADIDYCQANQDEAEKINVGATKILAGLCKENGAKLIFCSTDTVFSGREGNYSETDSPHPLNFYADSKIRAENVIRETCSNSVIARLSLVMGLPVMGSGNSFVTRTLASLRSGEKVRFPQNEIRTPVDVITVGRALVELAGNEFTGIIHLAGNDRINRYDMARQIARHLGFPPDMVVAVDSNAIAGRARRPDDVSLNNQRAKKILTTPMLSLAEGIKQAIEEKL